MNTKMSRPPVFYTLAQVKFNPIEMANYIPLLQDELRRSGYPDFRQETQLAVAVRRLDTEQPELNSQQITRWSFNNAQRTEGYLLLPDALIFHSTLYDSFENLSKKLITGLEKIHKTIGLSYIERVGLRYLNAVELDNHKNLLNPSLFCFSSLLKGTLKHNFTEIRIDDNDGTLVARAVIIDGEQLAIPSDLSPLQLEIQAKFSVPTEKTATLDFDHFSHKRIDFDMQHINLQLQKSHEVLTDAFHAAITNQARKAWR